jgi:hypothetical protein
MRINSRRLAATVAIAMLTGAMTGYWASGPSTASTTRTASSSHCSGSACMSHTWLWLPAMRRAR